ncbi:hypothetical protein CRYUN_Cryun12cG0055800 [Craigia yunnanensis]
MEQVEATKTDVEKKVERILKLIQRRNRAKKEPEIIGLVEDFHKQYQPLYAQYDNLKRESGKKALDVKGNESCSYDASSLDSEYYSSDDIEINTNIAFNNNRSFQRRMAQNIQEELERAYVKVADLNHQLASKTEEKEALASDHQAALSKTQEIETINRDLRKEVDEKENRFSAPGKVHNGQVTELEEQLIGLKTELESQHHQERDLEDQLDGIGFPMRQKTESEILLERKSKEISQYLIQVKTLKEELARKSVVERIMVEEKEGLQVLVMELESQVDALRKQRNKSENEERSNIRDINQLREEKAHLNARILELEALFRERGLELSAIQDSESKTIKKTIKKTAQIMTLNSEVELLQQKLDSVKMEKSQLELRIADQQRITKGREESTNNSMESNSKLARRLSLGTNLNFHVLERKMEDLAQEFRKKVEDNIRLLYQRITVAEKNTF